MRGGRGMHSIPLDIDSGIFEKAAGILGAEGLSVSDAVNLFLKRLVSDESKESLIKRLDEKNEETACDDAARTDNVINSSPIFIIRLKGREGNYKVIYANEKLLEYTPNKSLSDIQGYYDRYGLGIHLIDRDQENVAGIISSLKEVGQTNIAEGRVLNENGGTSWMRCMCTLVAVEDGENVIQQVITDVTKEKEAQIEVDRKREETYLRDIFRIISENTNDAYLLFSLEDFRAEYVTPNLERVTGIPQATVLEEGMDAVRPEGWETKDSRDSILKIEPGKSVVYDRVRTHRITGEIRQYTDTFYITNLNGRQQGLLIISDVTEEVKAKEALALALRNAEKASLAKSEFLSNMSHDIRTPMNSIMGMLTLLKKETSLTDKGKELFGKLEVSSNTMLEILNNVLDMSRIESGNVVLQEGLLKASDLINEIGAIYTGAAGAKGVKLSAKITLDHEEYLADVVAVKKVISNILSNAIKYTPASGNVEVFIRSKGENALGYDIVEFVCRDSGIGMKEEFVKRLFRPFEREMDTKINMISGTGLGLAIVKNLIDMMNGSISVESRKNEGTVIAITMPMKPAREKETKRCENKTTENVNIRGAKLLLVEDNELNAEIVTELLEDEGAFVMHAENGLKAVEMFLASKPGDIDLIFMDVQMPVMSGIEAARVIRKSSHPLAETIPIIAMTAVAFDDDIRKCMDAGMNAHASKPVNIYEIKNMIASFL